MPRDDPGLLVVPGSISCQLEDLCSEILHDSSHVDRGTCSYTGSVVSFAKKPGERESVYIS